jgi:hypothetical protein
MASLAPVIVFAYNRPKHLMQTLTALMKNSKSIDSDLYIYCDGPKKLSDELQIKKIIEIISNLKGFKKIVLINRKINLGLSNSIILGVSEVIEEYGKAIVVEDDVVVSKNFLSYMNNALDTYEYRSDIFSITGYNYNLKYSDEHLGQDSYLSYRSSPWGWGTWSDRWAKVDWNLNDLSSFKKSNLEIAKFEKAGKDLMYMLNLQMKGKINSWSIKFDFAHYVNNATCLHPRVSMVKNIGFDGSGTHKGNNKDYDIDISESASIIKLDPHIEISEEMLGPFNSKFCEEKNLPFRLRFARATGIII